MKKVDEDCEKSSAATFEYDFADRHPSERLTLELIKPLSSECVGVCACLCVCVSPTVTLLSPACRQTYHRTISESRVQQIAVQISVFHIGQDDHRGGVSFALHGLQTHTCTNSKRLGIIHTLLKGFRENDKNTNNESFRFTFVCEFHSSKLFYSLQYFFFQFCTLGKSKCFFVR